MLVTIMVPIAILIAGPLIDGVFKPLSIEDGALSAIVGAGEGRGIGLLFVILGTAMFVTALIAATSPRLRAVEDTDPVLPTAAPAAEPLAVAAGEA
jgi:hypothetical protein